jgi:trimeric autotransporter adhesin
MAIRMRMSLFAGILLASVLPSPPMTAASPSPAPFTLPPTDCPASTPLTTGVIATIAGGGSHGDGGPATDASIDVTVGDVAVDATGAVYFGGYNGPGVRKVGTDGVLSTFVARGAGSPLREASGLAFDASGNLYVADPTAARIWRIDAAGTVSPVAGTGGAGSTGDEGPALEATIHPFHVTAGPDGSLYLDDVPRYRVIDPDGIIHAFAGSTTPGFGGDGGAAVTALLGGADPGDRSYPDVEGSAVASDGSVYLTDNANSRIRKVDPAGVITTVAGNGRRGYTGDGGPALEATFQDPVDLALDEAGNLYISDHHNNVVRKVDRSGVISTVAGGGTHGGASGDCGLATEASIQPWAIAVHDGFLYIGDMANNRIRVVKL